MFPSTSRGGVSQDTLIPGMSTHTVRNEKKVILTCEGNKALLVGANHVLPCCIEDVRCHAARKGVLVCYSVEKAWIKGFRVMVVSRT
jgi:hypothetical protein